MGLRPIAAFREYEYGYTINGSEASGSVMRSGMGRLSGRLAALVAGALAQAILCGQGPAAAPLRDKSVLVLHSHERGLPAYEMADPALMAALRTGGLRSSQVFIEYLDLRRNPTPAYLRQVAEYLRFKYQSRKLDAIIAMHASTLRPLFAPPYSLFDDVPIISTLSGSLSFPPTVRQAGVVALGESYDLRGTVRIALDLLPRTQEVLVVNGVHSSDRIFEMEARRQLEEFGGRLRITYLSTLSAADMIRQVSAAPAHSIVLYLSVFEDVTGKSFVPKELLTEMCASASVPVFSIHDAVLDTGIVGGSMVSYAANGGWAGRTAVALLRGQQVPQPGAGPPPNVPMFEWRALERWNLSESRLPGNSVILDRPATIWNQYRGYVLGALALSLLQALLIAALSWQIRRRGLAEGSLRESRARFRGVLESSRDAAYRLDLETDQFDYMSPVAGQILQYGRQQLPELTGTKLVELIHPEDRERAHRSVFSAVQQGLSVFQVEYRIQCADGQYRWIDDFGSVVRDEQGRARYLSGALRDITARKKAEDEKARLEEQLRQSQKLESVGRLAGGVAHDFNNLLTVINGYGELVTSGLPMDDPVRAQVDLICQAGEKASRLTQQLLAFSRKQLIRPAPVNLNTVISGSLGMLRRLIGEDIPLRTNLEPALGLVLADAGQLDQILMNLAANARDAMPMGGELRIETSNVELDASYVATHPEVVVGPAVLLAVTDTGTGMDEETRRHVFEPFYTTKAEGRGTGLGLATVYGIVQQSRGWIWVYSEPGEGSTFKLYFPRLGSGESEAAPARGAETDTTGTETVLVVEDQAEVRALAVATLRARGYLVLEAASGPEALQIAQDPDRRIHALLTDVVMPEMNGRELAVRMKALRPETRVIYTSGYTEDAVVTRGVLTNEVEFLAKPYSPSTLLTAVRRVLGPKG